MPLVCFRRDDPPDHTTSPRQFCIRLDAVDVRASEAQPVIRFAAPVRRDRWRRAPSLSIMLGGYNSHVLVVRDEGAFAVHGSCDGVLLVSYKSCTYLCNPARRRWAMTLRIDGDVGFYEHHPSGEFRALHRSQFSNDFRIQTLTAIPPAVPRRITNSKQLLGAVRMRESPPALVAGSLHWLLQANTDLLVFDTVSESFRLMRPPAAVVAEAAYCQAQALLELDGKLTMTVTRGNMTAAQLWVLQDHKRDDSWDSIIPQRYSAFLQQIWNEPG